jgi:predicted enzyme related to lactoylglutathione lyase
MPATMPRSFFWYELMTSDRAAAVAFYRKLLGWQAKDFAGEGPPYTVLSVGGTGIGGVMELTPEMCSAGARPCWMGYIHVDDVDVYAARITAAGGKVLRGPADIPGVGRFAVAADPYGAAFMLLKGSSPQGFTPLAPGTPGGIGWHELHAGDGVGAFAFYSGLFGWTRAGAMDMGPAGVYQLFAAGAEPVGGMMTRMPETPATFWLFYFNVEAIDAATAAATAGGARVINGPMEVPGPMYVVQCLDPQGAMFAMVAPKR